jgi:uncharacterized membrane protein
MSQSISRDARSYRLTSIDFLRGLVIVIMAIDHVRDFFLANAMQDPMNQADVSPAVYLTRWITHFCAPTFVFLAGTSAGLMSARKSPSELGAFLVKRGLWLIFVEVAIISTSVTLAPLGIAELGGATLVFLQVIWAIGASMVLLGAAQFMGARACLYLGILILLGYNSLDALWPSPDLEGGDSALMALLFYQGSYRVGPFYIMAVYPLLAWFAVMLLGFGSSFIFAKESPARNTLLIRIGIAFVISFIVLRASGLYGDANPWQVQASGSLATVFDFMNVTKYPPSLLFLLATLGLRLRRPHGGLAQGHPGDVWPGALCFLCGALHPHPPAGHWPGDSAGFPGRRVHDLSVLLSRELWGKPGRRLPGLAAGAGNSLPHVPLDGRRKNSSQGLVAELSVRHRLKLKSAEGT